MKNFDSSPLTDFGLSNFISPGVRMKTFCGSPVYAAPEILKKKTYDGTVADIWSLGKPPPPHGAQSHHTTGVMLFTMVTGHLPWKPSNSNPENYFSIELSLKFENDLTFSDMLQGRFNIPPKIRVSQACLDILKRMINPDPKKRATVQDLRNHVWTNDGFHEPPPSHLPEYPSVNVDSSVVKQMVQMGFSSKEVHQIVSRNKTSPILTTYHTILNLSIDKVSPFILQDPNPSLPHSISDPAGLKHSSPIPLPFSATSPYREARLDLTTSAPVLMTPPMTSLSPKFHVGTPPLLAIARDLQLSASPPNDLLSGSPLHYADSCPLPGSFQNGPNLIDNWKSQEDPDVNFLFTPLTELDDPLVVSSTPPSSGGHWGKPRRSTDPRPPMGLQIEHSPRLYSSGGLEAPSSPLPSAALPPLPPKSPQTSRVKGSTRRGNSDMALRPASLNKAASPPPKPQRRWSSLGTDDDSSECILLFYYTFAFEIASTSELRSLIQC